jgi:DNA-binding SARP family transcriptional activator/tetratricopeptide (TPR) repeat protein
MSPRALPASTIHLQLLGNPLLFVPDKPPVALGAADATMLAVLALDGPQTRQSLATMLWPDGGGTKAAANLRQRIFKLKRLSGCDLVVGERTIALADTLSHDLQKHDEQTASDPGFGRDTLLGTLALKHNDVVADWLESRRAGLLQARVRVLDEQARVLADRGDIDAALRFARARVLARPLDEVGHRTLIGLLYRRHDRAAAMAAYRDCELLLQQELGIAPSPQTQELLRLLSSAHPGDRPPRSVPLSLTLPPALVGRSDVWRAIEHALRDGAVPLLVAGPGGGKTRLLGDFVARNAGWCIVRCLPGDDQVPLRLLQRLLDACAAAWGPADAVSDVAAVLARQATDSTPVSHTTVQAVSALLAQWCQAGLAGMAVDDLHHADALSLALLAPAWASGAAPRWLLTSQPVDHRTRAMDTTVCIQVNPLTVPEIEALIDGLNLPGLPGQRIARSLHRRVGGRPGALLATLTAAFLAGAAEAGDVPNWPIPPRTRSGIQSLIDALSPRARTLAQLAALAGADFHAELASGVLGLTLNELDAPWQELRTVLEMDDAGSLPQVAMDVALEALSSPTRLSLHLALAEALATRHADATVLAHHWEQAARWSEAACCHEQAAHECHARSDRLAQRTHWRQAARLWSRAGRHGDAFAATASEAECTLTAGLPAECAQLCETLQGQARSPDDWARVLRLRAWALGYQRDWLAALDVIEQALPAARLVGNTIWLSEILGLQACAWALLGRAAEAQAPLTELLAMDVSGAGWELQLNHRSRIADAYTYLHQLPEALATMEACLALAERPEAQTQRLSLLSNIVMLLFRAGQPAQGVVHARNAVRQAEQIHQLDGQVGGQSLLHLGIMAAAQGLFSEAVERAEQGLAVLRQLGARQPLAIASNHMAWLWCCLGQGARAQQALSEVHEDDELYIRLRRWTLQAHLHRLCGLSPPGAPPAGWEQCADTNVLTQAKMLIASGLAPRDGVARLAAIEAQCVRTAHPALALQASLLRIQALGRLDVHAASLAAAAAARRLGETTPLSAYRPEMHLILYQAMTAAGDFAAAESQLQLAWNWVQGAASGHVPPVFRDAFLRRNLVNVAIHQAVDGRRATVYP